jgi:DNA repair protein SbcD/Mre11
MAFRIVHFADLHLDAPFAWADPRTSALRRANRRRVLERIVALAADVHADLVSCGGDLFEQDLVAPDTVEFLRRTLGDAGCPVLLAPGNHDWYGPESPYARVRWPANVYVFDRDTPTAVDPADGIRLWGVAHRGPVTPRNLLAGFRVDGHATHLLLAHASETGALAWQGEGKQAHAPFAAEELERGGIDLALLGHYHAPRDDARYSYPGNPDPLEFGEEGERGALVVTIGEDGGMARARHRVAVSEVHDVEVDVDGARDRDEVSERVAASIRDLAGCVRVTLSGDLATDVQIDQRELARAGDHLDGFVVRAGRVTYAYDLASIRAEPTVRGQFVRDADAIDDPDLRRRVVLTGLRALAARDDLDVA